MAPQVQTTVANVQNANHMSVATKAGQLLAPLILVVTDYTAIVAALLCSWLLRGVMLPQLFPNLIFFTISDTYIYILIPSFYISILTYEGMYTRRLPFWQSAQKLFKICTVVSVVVIVTLYFLKVGYVSRLFIVLSWLLSFICLAAARYSVKRTLAAIGLWQRPVIVVGAGKTAELLAKAFEKEPNIGYKIAGLIEDNQSERPLTRQYPHIGSFANVESIIKASGFDDVIIAAPGLNRQDLINMVYKIQPHVKNLIIVPNLFGIPIENIQVDTIFSEKALLLSLRNNMMVLHNRVLKRVFDFTCSVLGSICILPILLGISVAIYIDSPGPIIFAHQRVGLNGRVFPCYKFRSMIPNAQQVLEGYLAKNPSAREEWERDFKLKADPRITRVGKFLRKTSLDELPQLLNIIRGEMSLVGPRPIVEKEIPKYGDYVTDYYLVSPGMTGFWQVSGRSDVGYDERVQMDSWYVRNWSLWLDIVLLFKTVSVVMDKRGAY